MNKTVKNLVPILIFLGLFMLMTFPLILRFRANIPGFFSTDESYAVLWNSWLIKFSIVHNLSINHTKLIAFPFGFELNKTIGYLFFAINSSLAIFTTPVLTYNIQILANFILNSMFTYLLVFHLTRNRLTGLFSGLIFGFCPYVFIRSWQHLGETYLWAMPAVLLGVFKLKQDNSLSMKLFCIFCLISATLNFNVVNYLLIMMGYVFCFYAVKKNARILKRLFIICVLSFIVVLPQFFPIFRNMVIERQNPAVGTAQNLYHRPFEDLFTQSAKPLSYLLPSVAHPIFGKFTERFVGTQLYGMSFTEHTLYLGWVPLILAFVAFKRRKKMKLYNIDEVDKPTSAVTFFFLLAVIAWLFSQPPWWNLFGFKILLPSFFMYKVLPMFRAYCRFGIVVMLAISVLAGFGLKFILDSLKNRILKILATCLFSCFVLFEFWNWPPYKVINVREFPAAYNWLKSEPGDIAIAEYPLDIIGPSELYRLYQTRHEKKIINGTLPGTYAHAVARKITRLSDIHTLGVLKWMGVKYILVHRDEYLNTELIEDKSDLEKIPKNPGLKFIKSFPPEDCPGNDEMCIKKTGQIDVYELVAREAIKPEIDK